MGDADQGRGPLIQALAPEVGDAVFGDHVAGEVAGRRDRGAGLELPDDAGELAALAGA